MNRGYNLVSEEKNTAWKFVVTDPALKNKDGSIKAKVKKICSFALENGNYEWDIIKYKGMVAFKVPTERKTFIYTKEYWEYRCFKNLLELKNIKVSI